MSQGFVVCSPEYRLTPHAKQCDAHEDVFDAFRYVQHKLSGDLEALGVTVKLDPSRTIAFGGSAGGTASLRLAADIEKFNTEEQDAHRLPQLRAIICAYPCTDVDNWCCKPRVTLAEGLSKEPSEVQQIIANFYQEPVSVSLKKYAA